MASPAIFSRSAEDGQVRRRFWLWHAGLPILLLLVGTVVFRWTGLDLAISRAVYEGGDHSWAWGTRMPWKALYDFGAVPGYVIFFGSLGLLAAGGFWPRARRWRLSLVFLVAVMIVGPGVLTHSLLKEYGGRPRPRQVQQFGGQYPFEPVLSYDARSPGRSFPSGHAAGAFYVMALYFVALFQGWSRWVSWVFLVGGFGFGLVMGVARILQGGHFATDVIGAFAVVWAVACVGAALILRLPARVTSERTPELPAA